MRAKGIIFTITSAVIFGITPALARLTYSMGSNPLTLTFLRDFLIIPVLLVIILIKKIDMRVTKKELLYMAILGIIGKGATTLVLYSSYNYVGTSVATTIHFMYPACVAFICFIFFKEKLGLIKGGALLTACVGVCMFLEFGQNKGAALGIFLALLSAVTFAIYLVGIEKTGLAKMNPLKLAFYMSIFISSSLLIYNIPVKQINFTLHLNTLIFTFVIAVSTSLIGSVLLQLGVKHLSATLASIFSLFEPVSSCFAGFLLLGETLSPQKIFGCVVIVGAITFLSVADSIKPKVGIGAKESKAVGN